MIYLLLAIILNSMKILDFAIYSILGVILPFVILIIVVGVYEVMGSKIRSFRRCCYSLLPCSCLLIGLIGFWIQVTYGRTCGVPCPSECPSWIPIPNFNHNAIFHIFGAGYNIVFGFWVLMFCDELESGFVDKDCKKE